MFTYKIRNVELKPLDYWRKLNKCEKYTQAKTFLHLEGECVQLEVVSYHRIKYA